MIALVTAVAARHRIRAAARDYALLIESTVRMRAGKLAAELGLPVTGTLPADIGDRLAAVVAPPNPGS